MKIIAFLGYSGSGKTTAIYRLTRTLISLGFKVGTIKHTHKRLSFDKPKKDSWTHSKAGASTVIAVSSKEMVTYRRGNFSNLRVDWLISTLRSEDLDFLLVEGFYEQILRMQRVIKIMCVGSTMEVSLLLQQHPKPKFIIWKNSKRLKSQSLDGIPILLLPRDTKLLVEKLLADYFRCFMSCKVLIFLKESRLKSIRRSSSTLTYFTSFMNESKLLQPIIPLLRAFLPAE